MTNTEQLYKEIEPLVDNLQRIHDSAIELFTPMAQDLCHRIAKEEEVESFLSDVLSYAMDSRAVELFRSVCREYVYKYPVMVNDYIQIYFELYEPEKSRKQ